MPQVEFQFTNEAIQRAVAALGTINRVKLPNGQYVDQDYNPVTDAPWTPAAWTRFVWRNMLHTAVVNIEKRELKRAAETNVDTDTDLVTE
jgi:hypothetical protein